MNIFDAAVAEIQVSYHPNIPAKDRIKVQTSDEVYRACSLFWPGFDHVEYFYILLLNRSNQILGAHLLSKGGITGTVIDVRVIFQVALKTSAVSLVCLHNHPSGNLTPSDADRQITEKIKQAGKILDISLLDHLIITSEKYFSFADDGLL